MKKSDKTILGGGKEAKVEGGGVGDTKWFVLAIFLRMVREMKSFTISLPTVHFPLLFFEDFWFFNCFSFQTLEERDLVGLEVILFGEIVPFLE